MVKSNILQTTILCLIGACTKWRTWGISDGALHLDLNYLKLFLMILILVLSHGVLLVVVDNAYLPFPLCCSFLSFPGFPCIT